MCYGFCAEKKNGPPPRSFAADAYDCIMVRGLGPHRIQGCGAIDLRARKAGSPLIVIPIASSVPPCSELSRYGLARDRGRGKVGATANLDSSCARRLLPYCGSGRRNGIPDRTKKPIKKARKQESKIAALKPLDNRKPIQAQAAPTVRLKVPMRRRGADCLVVATKWGNAHGARGSHRR